MQQKQGIQPKKDYKKELQKIRISFIKNGSSLRKFCDSQNLNRRNIHNAFSGKWNGEKAQQLRQRLIEASRAKPTTTGV